jgi:hypothetical protein
MTTAYHAKYFAHERTTRRPSDSIEKFMASLSDARVGLPPFFDPGTNLGLGYPLGARSGFALLALTY